MNLDPVSLRLFVDIVETGSITAAAENAHTAISAVSKRITDLETALKTRLLVRTNKGVEATPAGNALANMARSVLHELDDIVAQMSEYAAGVRGHVRVRANISAITQFLPRALQSFMAKHPEVQIRLQEDISTGITRAVAENAADIGVFTMISESHPLEVFPYRDDELVLITPRGHALAKRRSVAFAETLEFPYVGLHADSAINLQLIRAAHEAGRTMRTTIHVTSYDALCFMVESGMGIGIMPRAVAQPYKRTLGIAVVGLQEPWAKRQLKICVRSLAALPVAARLLVEHLRQPE
jgi:DNA-binding transcriptional LysR family regulator